LKLVYYNQNPKQTMFLSEKERGFGKSIEPDSMRTFDAMVWSSLLFKKEKARLNPNEESILKKLEEEGAARNVMYHKKFPDTTSEILRKTLKISKTKQRSLKEFKEATAAETAAAEAKTAETRPATANAFEQFLRKQPVKKGTSQAYFAQSGTRKEYKFKKRR
ncbi:hypothetical protein H0N95_00575, partial [Candidatus Micrarchaeota archaeon]|nr:hypothetical protein [Candidatus Micrarchaeota archaeon]